MEPICLGIIRETKSPPDKRVSLTPTQCRNLQEQYSGLKILVQPSGFRCFSDDEYVARGITLSENLSECQVLMGVKEVKIEALLKNKTYFFFSHTAKMQPYNRSLLNAVVDKGIRLIDYEYLTGKDKVRVVAFGRWAGVVGAYNGLRALGLRSRKFDLRPAHECRDLEEVKVELEKVEPGNNRIVVTGGGRVASGVEEILQLAGIPPVDPEIFLTKAFKHAVYTRLDPWHYTRRKDGNEFDFNHFVMYPASYRNNLHPYAKRCDLYLACHFWDPASPELLSADDLENPEIPIYIIADISCDIKGPIASTIRASTIEDPFYGYDPVTRKETEPFQEKCVTVMAVDNLPGELPRDASADFGAALMHHVIPELMGLQETGMLERASITSKGTLTGPFIYLQDFLAGK